MALEIIDPADFGGQDMFRQEEFLSKVSSYEWSSYRGKRVLVRGCGSGLIPPWAFMCLTARLAPFARTVLYGNEHDYVEVLSQSESS